VSFPKPYADRVAKLRVPGGIVLAVAFLYLSEPTWPSIAYGTPISVAGLALRAWAAGHLEKNIALAESGPYAWVRNPLYLGTLLTISGLAIAARRWEIAALAAAVFLLIYLPVVELEEQHLRSLFPEYQPYAERVPKLWPKRPEARSTGRFESRRYVRNEEYKALAGFLAGLAVLCVKASTAVVFGFHLPF